MKNKFILANVSLVLLLAVLGCSFYNPLQSESNISSNNTNARASKESDKTLAEKAIDSTVGEEKIGIPECDELLDSISEQSKNQDDDYVAKAGREFFLNRIRESIRKSFEENKNDPKEAAKNCKDLKRQLDKFKAEEDGKNAEK
jgi:polyhydroxyalkanoate synthesis regulator phasin